MGGEAPSLSRRGRMRRKSATILRLLAVALLVATVLMVLATIASGPWWRFSPAGICDRWAGTFLGLPRPFYYVCYGPPLAGEGSPVKIVWDGVAVVVDFGVWYLVSLGLVALSHWWYAPRRYP